MIESRRGFFRAYFDRRDWWIGVYISDRAIYVCPLPCMVFCWLRG